MTYGSINIQLSKFWKVMNLRQLNVYLLCIFLKKKKFAKADILEEIKWVSKVSHESIEGIVYKIYYLSLTYLCLLTSAELFNLLLGTYNLHSTRMAINTAGKSVFSPTHWSPFLIYVLPGAHHGMAIIKLQPRVIELLGPSFLHSPLSLKNRRLVGGCLERDISPSLFIPPNVDNDGAI